MRKISWCSMTSCEQVTWPSLCSPDLAADLHFPVGPTICPSNRSTLGDRLRLSERPAVCGLPSTSDMLSETCPYIAASRSSGSR